MKDLLKKHVTQGGENRKEYYKDFPGYYAIVTPPLGNGKSFSVLYNPQGEPIAKLNKPATVEERGRFTREYLTGLKNDKS